MIMVSVNDSRLQADSRVTAQLGWGSAATWRCPTFIWWTV